MISVAKRSRWTRLIPIIACGGRSTSQEQFILARCTVILRRHGAVVVLTDTTIACCGCNRRGNRRRNVATYVITVAKRPRWTRLIPIIAGGGRSTNQGQLILARCTVILRRHGAVVVLIDTTIACRGCNRRGNRRRGRTCNKGWCRRLGIWVRAENIFKARCPGSAHGIFVIASMQGI